MALIEQEELSNEQFDDITKTDSQNVEEVVAEKPKIPDK